MKHPRGDPGFTGQAKAPRLNALRASSSSYSTPVNWKRVYGAGRINFAGNPELNTQGGPVKPGKPYGFVSPGRKFTGQAGQAKITKKKILSLLGCSFQELRSCHELQQSQRLPCQGHSSSLCALSVLSESSNSLPSTYLGWCKDWKCILCTYSADI